MQGVEIQDYARQMFQSMGPKAIAEAAKKARELEEQGKRQDASTWREIEASLKTMAGPHQS